MTIRIGIIGGSGLYRMETLENKTEHDIDTPYGKPSSAVITGTIAGEAVAFIPRHGKGHRFNPSEVPYRANIYALKSLGVDYIVAVSACGSLREDYAPGHFCVPDQLFDFTKGKRDYTFFEKGVVAHVGVADPFCNTLRSLIADATATAGGTIHRNGTYVTIEGPRFSTRAESNLYRQWGMDIIGMTTSPEAFLAREAEICYAVAAMITDYDVWHEHDVTVEMVMETMSHNLETAQKMIIDVVPKIASLSADLPAHNALKGTLTSSKKLANDEIYQRLGPLAHSLFD